MSRMQDALFRKDYDCAKPACPLTEMCEADTEERFDKSCHGDTLRESDRRQLKRSPIMWIVHESPTGGDRPAAERTARLKSGRMGSTRAPGTRKRSESRKLSAPGNESPAVQPRQREDESVAAQIRRFQERADLRECLLPGMLSGVSRKACEGWQRQESVRNSRMLAKIKLESCKKCRYGLESALARF